MTSSSDSPRAFPNVPPPPGSKAGTTYARFIPREELGDFAAWQPGAIDAPPRPRPLERRAEPRPEGAPLPNLEEWRAKIAEARRAGYQDGYRDGLVALENFKQSFAAQITGQLGTLVQSFDEQWSDLEQRMADSITRSAMLMAQHVLRAELQTQPHIVATVAQEAVNAIMLSARQIVVAVNPEDLELVQSGAAEVLQARGARLAADPSVARGGCRVESDAGTIDATIATRWAQSAVAFGEPEPWPEVQDDDA